jgi:hypothetical protein
MISKYLEKTGFGRYQPKLYYYFLLVIVTAICSIRVPNSHWSLYAIVSLIATIFGIQRFELWYSLRMGRWWWLKEK